MKYEIYISWIKDRHYHVLVTSNEEEDVYGYWDSEIAEILEMDPKEYREILIKEFNGIEDKYFVLFKNKKDIEKVRDWVESTIFLKKLSGDKWW